MGFQKLAYICNDCKKSTPSMICSVNEILNYVKDKNIYIHQSKKKTKELALIYFWGIGEISENIIIITFPPE